MNKKGFTLIELMIVVSIIGVLVAVVSPLFMLEKKTPPPLVPDGQQDTGQYKTGKSFRLKLDPTVRCVIVDETVMYNASYTNAYIAQLRCINKEGQLSTLDNVSPGELMAEY